MTGDGDGDGDGRGEMAGERRRRLLTEVNELGLGLSALNLLAPALADFPFDVACRPDLLLPDLESNSPLSAPASPEPPSGETWSCVPLSGLGPSS